MLFRLVSPLYVCMFVYMYVWKQGNKHKAATLLPTPIAVQVSEL